MALPIMTSHEDVQKIVDYFKNKATGATIEEAKPILKKYLDPRKVSAYLKWKILKKDGDKVKLDDFGRQLSRTNEEGKKDVYSKVLNEVKAYHACIEWAFHQQYNTLTNVEVASFWHENYPLEVKGSSEDTIKDSAVTFFYICQAAGLGKFTIGRKGLSTRFDFDSSTVGQYIGALGLTSENDDINDNNADDEKDLQEESKAFSADLIKVEVPILTEQIVVNHKVFISHSANLDIVDQIKTMLDIAGLEYEVAVDKESTAIPVPEKVFAAMRRSTSAIICVTADEKLRNGDGNYTINQNVLIEIGAAFVLYDKKVALVWDKRIQVPSNLQGLYRCEFQGEELTWSAGMKLMKAMAEFKK